MKYILIVVVFIGFYLLIDAHSQKQIVELNKVDDCIIEKNKEANLPSKIAYETYGEICVNQLK